MSVREVTMDLLGSRVPLTLLFDLALGAPDAQELYAAEQRAPRRPSEQLAS